MTLLLQPKISVVMAVYNGEPYIKDTIQCILDQTFEDFEFIIVNDRSTDTTAETVSSFKDPRIILINNEINVGSSRAGNIGLERAKSKYIARIDADDLSPKDRFQKQYDYLETHPNVAVLGSSFTIIGTDTRKDLPVQPEEIAIKLFLGQNCVAHSAVMMRKDIFDIHGFRYNPDNPVSQDYELWADVSSKLKVANLTDYLMEYRVHEGQISTKRYQEQQEHAMRIVTSHLRQYMPSATEEQSKAHLALTGFIPVLNAGLDKVLEWATTLKQFNKSNQRFDFELFERYLNDLSDKSKKNYFNKTYFLAKCCSPSLAIGYFQDAATFGWNAKAITVVKFIVKSLIFKKSK